MRTLALTFMTALALTLSAPHANAQKSKSKESTTKFSVDLHCESCVKKIEGNIAYEKGVRDMKVSLEKKEVDLTYRNDRTSPEALIKAFEKIGYKASVIGEAKKDTVQTKQ